MHVPQRLRRGPLAALAALLVSIALVDAGATAVVAVVHRNDPPALPAFLRSSAALRPGADPYPSLPASYGFTTTPAKPATADGSGRVRTATAAGAVVDPDLSAQYALAALAAYDRDRDRAWLTRAGRALTDVMAQAPDGLVRHGEPGTSGKQTLPAGWVSASTQGLVLSALVRLHAATSDERWATEADHVFDALLRFRDFAAPDGTVPTPSVGFVDVQQHLWFLEHPQAAVTDEVVTAHVFALFGLADFARSGADVPRTSAARSLLAGGLATVEAVEPELRVIGGAAWTSPQRVERSLALHHVLVDQLRALTRMTGAPRYRTAAAALDEDTVLAPFRVTGATPRGEVDAYAGLPGSAVLPPVGAPGQDPDAVLAQALGSLAAYGRTHRPADLASARARTDAVLRTATGGLVPHTTPVTNSYDQALATPWWSAQTQGLLLSALARLRTATDEARYDAPLRQVFATLQRARGYAGNSAAPPLVWTTYVGDDKSYEDLWFEKYPHPQGRTSWKWGTPSLVLDAQATVLFGLYDYWRVTRDPLAARLFDGGASTLVSRLPDVRVAGGPSRTALLSKGADLADHRVLTAQLALLAQMSGRPELAATARQFAADAR